MVVGVVSVGGCGEWVLGLLPLLTRLLGFMVSALWSGCGRGCG